MRVKPFRGLRPDKNLVEKVASPPYDVLDREEALEIARNNPYSFLHVIKPEIDLPPDVDLYDERVYEKGAENLKRFIQEGILKQDPRDYFYIYRQKMGDHVQTGLVVAASCQDYAEGKIKRHELTREAKELDRTKHILYTNANTGPVFLLYRNGGSPLKEIVGNYTQENEPEYDFESGGVRHSFWVVRDEGVIKKIKEIFEGISHLYIADGHHRAAAAHRVMEIKKRENPGHTGNEEYNFFLAVVFPHDEMQILPYNRAVKDLGGLSPEEFLEKVKEKFHLSEGEPVPRRKHQISMFLGGKWYFLVPREGTYDPSDPVSSLDVAILQENLLGPILGIENPRKDPRISFIGGIKGTDYLEELVRSGKYAVAFSMYPTSVEELLEVADQGKIMPPKSTWFEPKLKSGLVVHLLS